MTSTDYKKIGNLKVAAVFHDFVLQELLPACGIEAAHFWTGLAHIVTELTPENRRLLAVRDALQVKIDAWCTDRAGRRWDHAAYKNFLVDIGYLEEAGEPFRIETKNVDPELAEVAGPQLVVPVSNARFALNAANARWGSLYDALYGTDVIGEDNGCEKGATYNPRRGQAVMRHAAEFLDRTLPLVGTSHGAIAAYVVDDSGVRATCRARLADGGEVPFIEPGQFVAYDRKDQRLDLLFLHNKLHIEIQTDPAHPVGKSAPGHVRDVVLEAAVTTIQDCEDSVAAVDAEDKVQVYRNWLGLMQGTLEARLEKSGKTLIRRLQNDRLFKGIDGSDLVLPGLSTMLVRNVGHLMTTDAVRDAADHEIFEGIVDAVVTSACAMANARQTARLPNSRSHSIYIVKPKMHGPQEAAFTNTLFARVEDMLGLERYSLKVGVMDEERRTTVNLMECIRAVRERLVFINTGFLDRTGDEIHTSMLAAPMLPKEAIKSRPWIKAYEDWNVDIGIRCGLPGRAQIGKGMWPKPDEMRDMLDSKQAHPEAGASCAWVPSPTAATLHAMHYHAVDVRERQHALASRPLASLDDILAPPVCAAGDIDASVIRAELDNNAQGILGYVVRWVDQGIGCSKVPDINDVGLMEDRATLRISSQHIANWLLHGIVGRQQVMDTMKRMATIVDKQNEHDPAYTPMSEAFDSSVAFNAACDLVFKGGEQPNGYTEPLLHAARRRRKAQL